MGVFVRSCVQWMLKLANSILAMFGVAMILYALWMIRAWQKQMGHSFPTDIFLIPWFMYAFLGMGVILCLITCSGHIAAETANRICLSIYMFFVFLLMMLEAALTTDVFLNRSWEEDFPVDPSGHFDEFKNFVKKNFDICKWVALCLVAVQGASILLGLLLKGLGPYQKSDDSDSDNDDAPDRLPLLRTTAQQPYYGPNKNDAWNQRISDKTNR